MAGHENMKGFQKRKPGRFDLDFIEFAFLVEACIPPCATARMVFWDRVINKYYHRLAPSEVKKLFTWITTHPDFDNNNPDCKWFYDRYSAENQYTITTTDGDLFRCFLRDGKYHSGKNVYIEQKYISKIEEYDPSSPYDKFNEERKLQKQNNQ